MYGTVGKTWCLAWGRAMGPGLAPLTSLAQPSPRAYTLRARVYCAPASNTATTGGVASATGQSTSISGEAEGGSGRAKEVLRTPCASYHDSLPWTGDRGREQLSGQGSAA
jgi:hypothetical protein